MLKTVLHFLTQMLLIKIKSWNSLQTSNKMDALSTLKLQRKRVAIAIVVEGGGGRRSGGGGGYGGGGGRGRNDRSRDSGSRI